MSLSCAVFFALDKQASHKGARKWWLSALATSITGWFLRAVLDGGTGTTASTCTPQPFTNSPAVATMSGFDRHDSSSDKAILQEASAPYQIRRVRTRYDRSSCCWWCAHPGHSHRSTGHGACAD